MTLCDNFCASFLCQSDNLYSMHDVAVPSRFAQTGFSSHSQNINSLIFAKKIFNIFRENLHDPECYKSLHQISN